MNTKKVSRGLVSKLQRTLLAALIFIVLFGSLPVDKAHAWGHSTAQGRPGSASGANVYISDLYISSYKVFTLSTNTGPFAWRSPGSTGSQIIRARYYVQQWNGSQWVTVTQSALHSRQISSTQTGVSFPALYISPSVSRGYFRVLYGFDWLTSTGTLLGSVFVYPHLTTDHICLTQKRPCAVAAGHFWVDRLY